MKSALKGSQTTEEENHLSTLIIQALNSVNHKPTTYQWMDWLYLNIAQRGRLMFDIIKSNF